MALVNFLVNRFESQGGRKGFPFVRRRRHRNVQILTYHRVTREPDALLPSIPSSTFRRQMCCLAERFRVLRLEDAVTALRAKDVPDNAVVVTFDDGYRDNYEHAFPVLRELGLPATVFLVSRLVGSTDLLWHDRVFRAFGSTQRTELPEFGPAGSALPLRTPVERQTSRETVLSRLKALEPDARDAMVSRIEDALESSREAPIPERAMLDWNEVREMHRAGMSFGSHTASHPVLARIPADEARREIEESKATIERALGAGISTFAYPNGRAGDFTAETKQMVGRAGYTAAVTTIFGSNAPGCEDRDLDLLELRRVGIEDADPAMFVARMNAYKFAS